ncbi:MAG: helix-turn-helix domain-containing protein [Clostridia bacterium]|nr:helix-turn-helix domain-containing protein [Clostridia bacterium]
MKNEIERQIDTSPINILINSIENDTLHWHDVLEIIFVVEGTANVKIGYETYLLHEGDIAVINTKDLHSINQADGNNLVFNLQLDIHKYKKKYPNIDQIIFVCEPSMDQDNVKDELKELRYLISQILLEYYLNASSNSKKIINLVDNLLSNLMNHFQYFSVENNKFTNKNGFKDDEAQFRRVNRIIYYLYSNYSNKITLKQLAEKEEISTFYLSHLIKRATGLSFQDFLNYIRVEESEKLLLDCKKKMIDISYECGFSDIRYFRKHFRKWHNCSPSEFREKYLLDKGKLPNNEKTREISKKLVIDKLEKYLGEYNVSKNNEIEYEVDLSHRGKKFEHSWKNEINLGNTLSLLRGDYQQHIQSAQHEIGFRYAKIEHIFNENLNWHSIFYVLNFLESIHLTPIIRIDSEKELNKEKAEKFIEATKNRYGFNKINEWHLEIVIKNEKGKEIRDEVIDLLKNYFMNIRIIKTAGHIDLGRIYDTYMFLPYIVKKLITHDEFKFEYKLMDEYGIGDEIFKGDNGLITCNGFKKAAYHAIKLLSLLGDEIILNQDGLIVTKKSDDYQILLYGDMIQNKYEVKNFSVRLLNIKGSYLLTTYSLNKENGCIYTQYNDIKATQYFPIEIENSLIKKSIPKIIIEKIDVNSEYDLFSCIPNGGIELMIINKV